MRILLLTCCLMFSSFTFAQVNYLNESTGSLNGSRSVSTFYMTPASNKLSFGIHVSPTISWFNINHDDLHTDGATITGGVGLITEYMANRTFSFVSGLNYTMSSGYVFDSYSLNDLTTANNFLIKFTAVEIPVLLRIKTPTLDNIIYYTQGGINAGVRLSSKESHNSTNSSTDDIETSFNKYSTPFQLSYSIGFGASYNLYKHLSIFGEINYKSSLTNLASTSGFTETKRYNPTSVPEIYNGNLIFTIGLMF